MGRTEPLAGAATPPKRTKVISITPRMRGIHINCNGCDVTITRDERGTIVHVTNTSENHPLEVTVNTDSAVKIEATR